MIKKLLTFSPEIRKLYAALGIVGAVVAKALSDGHIDGGEIVEIVSSLVGAFGVFQLKNAPSTETGA